MSSALKATELFDLFSLLKGIQERALQPAEAQAAVAAWESKTGRKALLAWDGEPAFGKVYYDVICATEGGSISVSFAPDDGVPWVLRGARRVQDQDVGEIDGQLVSVQEALFWANLSTPGMHGSEALIDRRVLARALDERGIEVTAGEVEDELTRFRGTKGLETGDDFDTWLRQSGANPLTLESGLRLTIGARKLRAVVVSGQAIEEAFRLDPRRFVRFFVARCRSESRQALEALSGRLRSQDVDLVEYLRRGHARSDDWALDCRFSWLLQGRLDEAVVRVLNSTSPGSVAGPVEDGEGFTLVQLIRREEPDASDTATRELIRDTLFDEWLRRRRGEAKVRWFWGRQSA